MRASVCVIVAILLALVVTVGAIPSTTGVTNITNNGFVLGCTGAINTTHFQFGTNPDHLNLWTMYIEPTGGAVTSTEYGSPIMHTTHYFVSACDETGCDATPEEFDTSVLVPLPVSTLGTAITNMTRSRFNMLYLPGNLAVPYGWLFPSDQQSTAMMIVFGTLFFFVYIGLWLRTRSVGTGVIIGLLTSSFILFADSGLNLGIPPEFAGIAQGLLYASLAGIILAWLKK